MSNYKFNISKVRTGTALVSGGTLGALYYDNKIYQFAHGGFCQVCDKQFNKLYSFTLPSYADANIGPHCSTVEWLIPGLKLVTTMCQSSSYDPYAANFYVYDISDLSNITQDIVVMNGLDSIERYKRMAGLCYNPTTKTMYVGGYTSNSGSSSCWFETYDFTPYLTSGTLSVNRTSVKEVTHNGVQGIHIQDGNFHNGYLYYMGDKAGPSGANNEEGTWNGSYSGLYLWVLDTNLNHVALINLDKTATAETEAFFIIPETDGTKFVISICTGGHTYYQLEIAKENAVAEPTKYTVTFLDWNGKILKLENVLPNGTITAPTPVRDGYTFTAWDTAVVSPVVASAVYTATYTEDDPDAVKYTIVFKDYDDSVISTQTVVEGSTITIPSNPTRTGYNFAGWSPTVSNTATANATYTAQYTLSLVLSKTLNVTGYTIDGVANTNDTIELSTGTYTIAPIMRTMEEHGETLTADFVKWSDDSTESTRTITVTNEGKISGTETNALSASGINKVVYLLAAAIPSSGGTSIQVANSAGNFYFNTVTNVEYTCCANKLYNENDSDITIEGGSNIPAAVTTYFTNNNITEGQYYFASFPEGTYPKVKVNIYPGTGESAEAGDRNPNIFFVGGTAQNAMAKFGGNDMTRPLDASAYTETGFTFDFSAYSVGGTSTKTATVKDATSMLSSPRKFVTARFGGASNRLFDGYMRVEFLTE